ncbi:MAG: aspartate/glutamate racemase family protein [Candidatus Odinarchaeota archaeon]
MKTIGLIGGMSWESSLEYYRLINEFTKEILGGLHSAKILMHSVDFHDIEELQRNGEWKKLAAIMVSIAKQLEKAGADLLLICTNTMHLMADEVQKQISIPLIHIADATAQEIQHANFKTVGLLGTKFTMEKEFYKDRLLEKYGIKVIIPDDSSRQAVHDVIYNELVLGILKKESKAKLVNIINNLNDSGAEGIILGCTEIPLLIKQDDVDIPLLNTTEIHAEAAVHLALQKD